MTAGDILFIVSFIILPTAIIVSCIWALVLIRRGVLFANQSPRSTGQAYESGYGPGYVDDDAVAMDLDMGVAAYEDDAEPMPVVPYTPVPTPASIAPSAPMPAPAPVAAAPTAPSVTRPPARRAAAPTPAPTPAPAPLASAPAPGRESTMPAPLVRSTAPDAAPPAVQDRTDFTDELPLLPPNTAAPAAPVAPASAPAPAPAPASASRATGAPTWSETGEIATTPSGAYAGEPVTPQPAESTDTAARPRRQPGSAGLRPRARRAAPDVDGDR